MEGSQNGVITGLASAVWGFVGRQYAIVVIGSLLLGSIVAIAVHTFLRRSATSPRFPPGPKPWPVVGNFPLLGSLPHRDMAEIAKKYGGLFYLKLGQVDTLVVSSLEMATEFLKTKDHVFLGRPDQLAFRLFSANGKDIAFAEPGSHWRYMREICMTELITVKQLTGFRPARTYEISSTMNDILAEVKDGKVVDLESRVTEMITNTLTRMLFNRRYFAADQAGQKEAQWFKELQHKANLSLGAFVICDFITSLHWVTKLQGVEASMKNIFGDLHQFVQKIIDDHRQLAASGDREPDSPKDFIDIMLTLPSEDGTGHLSDEIVRSIVIDSLTGGIHTTVLQIVWAMAELIRAPYLMKRVHAELDAVVGTDRLVQESDLKDLKHLQAVIKESYRLHLPAPLLLPHQSLEPCEVAGYHIPAKTRLVVNMWAMARDPTVWDRPLEFDPERFMQHPEIDVHGHHFQLIPFGADRRICPGMSLAVLEVQITLARLLQSFTWSLPNEQPSHTLDMSEVFGLTLARAQPLQAVAAPRLSARLQDVQALVHAIQRPCISSFLRDQTQPCFPKDGRYYSTATLLACTVTSGED